MREFRDDKNLLDELRQRGQLRSHEPKCFCVKDQRQGKAVAKGPHHLTTCPHFRAL